MIQARSHLLLADFFTSTHRFSANIAIGNRSLVDILNDRMSTFLEVKNAYVSRIDRPGEISGTYNLASLMKEQITFIVLTAEAHGLSSERRYNTFGRRLLEDTFLSVPSFEISGKLEIVGKFDLKAILSVGTTTFMPIFQGTATHAYHPEVSFMGPIILINKVAIEFFSVLARS